MKARKSLLQERVVSSLGLVIEGEVIERIDHFTFLVSLISPDSPVSDEILAQIKKARVAFANVRHLWRKQDIRLPTKGQVYCSVVCSTLLYGCEI